MQIAPAAALDTTSPAGLRDGTEPGLRTLIDRGMTQLYEEGNPLAARDTAQQALERATATAEPFGRALALHLLGEAESHLGDRERALAHYRAARQAFADLGDAEGAANTLLAMAVLELSRQDHAAAKPLLEEARQLFGKAGIRYGQARAETNLGYVAAMTGAPQEALAHHRAAQAIYRDLSAAPELAESLMAQGDIHRGTGDYEAAKASYHAAHAYHALAQDPAGEGEARFAAAQMEFLTGHPDRAGQQLAAAQELFRQSGRRDAEGEAMLFAAQLAFERGDRLATLAALDDARRLFEAAGDLRRVAAVLQRRGGMQSRIDPAAASRDFSRCAEIRAELGLEQEAKLCRAAAAVLEQVSQDDDRPPPGWPARR